MKRKVRNESPINCKKIASHQVSYGLFDAINTITNNNIAFKPSLNSKTSTTHSVYLTVKSMSIREMERKQVFGPFLTIDAKQESILKTQVQMNQLSHKVSDEEMIRANDGQNENTKKYQKSNDSTTQLKTKRIKRKSMDDIQLIMKKRKSK